MHTDSPIIGITYSSAELDEFLLWRRMFHGIVAAGGTPLAIDCATPQPNIHALMTNVDGLIISGGGDVDPAAYGGNPEDPVVTGVNHHRDSSEFAAFDEARALGLPVLAICRGAQLVNVALGGTLYADLERDASVAVRHRMSEEALSGPLHSVTVRAGSMLAKWLELDGAIEVNSEHHQGIQLLAPPLVVAARSADGLVEGFELPDERVVGVQWHPEVLWPTGDHARALLSSFVNECLPNGPTRSDSKP